MALDPLVIAFGLGVGLLVGLTGIGGGSLMTPLLILFAGVQPVVAIGTDLAYGAITKTLGGWRHLRKGTVDLGVSKWLAVGSVPGSLVGVALVDWLHADYGHRLRRRAAHRHRRGARGRGGDHADPRAVHAPRSWPASATPSSSPAADGSAPPRWGSCSASWSAMTSVGSGALIGLVLILVFRLTPHRVVGTDVFHAAILLWAAGLAHWVSGSVDLALMANILVGSLPGVLIGTSLITRVPAAGLRPGLGCVLIGAALGVLSKAGLDIPTWTIPTVPAAIGLMAFVLSRSRGAGRSHRSGRIAPMKIIGAGVGRTGTLSTKAALEQLGYGPCHHMVELLVEDRTVDEFAAAARGERVDWTTVLDGYGSSVDWPACDFHAQLAEDFPEAKLLLNVRDPEKWYESVGATIHQTWLACKDGDGPIQGAKLEVLRDTTLR